MPLNDLVGEVFRIGGCLVYGGRLNVPCRYLERLIDKDVFEPLLGQSGLNCQILEGGEIDAGDVIHEATAEERMRVAERIVSS